MKKAKRILAAFSAALLLLGLCSCKAQTDEPSTDSQSDSGQQQVIPTASITLPIAHNDTLDPFKDISAVNRSLVTLLYDSLVLIDEEFNPQNLLAERYSLNGTTLSVTLAAASFADGSAVTGEDVVYSFEQAKKSSYYSARLSGFSRADASGNTVVFTLKSADIFAASSLDFPIVKSGSVQTKYDGMENYDIVPPMGSGRYYLNGTLPNATLVLNSLNPRNASAKIGEIKLFEVSDSDGLAYGLQIGNYDYWYNDISSGEYFRVNAGMSVVPTNNLVYLGFNSDKKIFQESEVRRAVSLLLSRDEIAAQGFQGHAAASVLPFNPAWSAIKNITTAGSSSAQTDLAKELLESVGYTGINTYGYRCSSSLSLNCTLLVCSGNSFKSAAAEQIKQALAALNFNVRIVELDKKAYEKAIAEGEFEMYLGEIKIPANMSLSEFFSSSGAANTVVFKELEDGVTEISASVDAYNKFVRGEYSLSDFCRLFESEMPFVPLCYRYGVQVYSRDFKTEIKGTCYDNFYNISDWDISEDEND